MTPERALKVISEDGRESGEGTWEEYLKAIQLGRDALKLLINIRAGHDVSPIHLLPGETEE